jgi:hypothetical protein
VKACRFSACRGGVVGKHNVFDEGNIVDDDEGDADA